MKIAETVPVPYRRKPRTQDRKSTIDLFYEGGIVLEVCAHLADRPGATQFNGVKYFHTSMCDNGRPVMPENDYRQEVSQNYVYNNPCSERDKRFNPGIR
jgi:hypothetical protein